MQTLTRLVKTYLNKKAWVWVVKNFEKANLNYKKKFFWV